MLSTPKRSTLSDWVANGRRTTISYFGSKEQAKKDCMAADVQIDGNETSNTSPVLRGSEDPGGAPMEGTKEFTTARTRAGKVGQGSGMRRAYPETEASR